MYNSKLFFLITSLKQQPREIPEFEISYAPDFRDGIARSWPSSIDDLHARADWGWKPEYSLDRMTEDMIKELGVLS